MNILDVEIIEELVDACQYFWEAGWGEYHAGNISYLLSDAEMDQLKDYMPVSYTHLNPACLAIRKQR